MPFDCSLWRCTLGGGPRIAVVTFGPFGGRGVNGSTTVGQEVVQRLQAAGYDTEQIVLPVAWQSLRGLMRSLKDFEIVLGLGEGFTHFMSVERHAFRVVQGIDEDCVEGLSSLLPEGSRLMESPLRWRDNWLTQNLRRKIGLSSPGIVSSAWGGYYLCNALHYLILTGYVEEFWKYGGFIHLPPQQAWMKETGLGAGAYADAFAAAVMFVLQRNGWIYTHRSR